MNRDEMERLTSHTDNKSEKVRILFNAGVERGDIGRFLGIRYQHVHNVLKRSGLLANNNQSVTVNPTRVFQVVVEKGRRINLPQEYADEQNVGEGDTLFCREEAGNLVIMSRPAAIEAVRDIVRKKMPEEASLLEALIAPSATPT